MNNIFLNNDPLLYRNSTIQQPQDVNNIYQQAYRQQLMNEMSLPVHDWIGELDSQIKGLDADVIRNLNENSEYVELSNNLLNLVQVELMNLVRQKLNVNLDIVDNIKKQQEIIQRTTNKIKDVERQSMSELNDYMKNYSHLTFDEYKRIKQLKLQVKNNENTTDKTTVS